jgi:ABC-type transport system involved in cytochrome c biogenesis permease subunit
MEITIIRIISPLSYLVATIFYWRYFADRRSQDQHIARYAESAAMVIHTTILIILGLGLGHVPLAGAFQALTTFMWFFAILNKLLIHEGREYTLGFFQTAVLFIIQSIAMIFINVYTPLPAILQNIFFEIHVLLNLIGYASFSSAFLAGMMYLLLYHEIRGSHLGYFYDRLPSLAYLEKLNYRALLIGFIFNTAGIIVGVITGKTAWGIYWTWDPKLIAVAIAWLIYALAVLGRYSFHWKGNRLAYLSIIGFAWILFSMLIINNYFSKIHSFG